MEPTFGRTCLIGLLVGLPLSGAALAQVVEGRVSGGVMRIVPPVKYRVSGTLLGVDENARTITVDNGSQAPAVIPIPVKFVRDAEHLSGTTVHVDLTDWLRGPMTLVGAPPAHLPPEVLSIAGTTLAACSAEAARADLPVCGGPEWSCRALPEPVYGFTNACVKR